jgi:peptidoglycan/LPS O-acetylase OafA/YrhL
MVVNDPASHGAGRRYESLDAWRGIAALSVVLFHCANTIVSPDTAIGRLLLAGWTGVFLFFPISGYCILGALHSDANRTLGSFLARRWRRIFLPYWASIVVAVAIAIVALPFNAGSIDDLVLTPDAWVAMLTLTQVFTDHVGRINPVYWSLCYEEQFYLVMGFLLAARERTRAAVLAAITVAAAIYVAQPPSWRVQGLFLDYWMCFAAGCAAYLWLHARESRAAAIVIAMTVSGSAVATGNVALSISIVTAAALVILAPFDARLARSRIGTRLVALGTVSYSLYLVHVPIGGRLTNLLDAWSCPAWATVPLSAAASLVAARMFYYLIESPARPSRPARTTARSRLDPTASNGQPAPRGAQLGIG